MSLILDALKKSDNERHRKSNPSIADVRVAAAPQKAPTWLWWLVGLLGVNLLILMFVLLRPGDDRRPDTVTSVAPVVRPQQDTVAQQTPTELLTYKEEVRSLSREANAAPTGEYQSEATPASAGDSPAPAERVVEEDRGPALRMYEELRAAGGINLPTQHIDLHVYHSDSTRRLIYINGKKYAQGDTTADGLRIEEIRRNGAWLSYRGNDFLLPRD